MISHVARYSLYGVLLVAGSGLAAVTAFPELSLYAPLIAEAPHPLANPEVAAKMISAPQPDWLKAYWANGGCGDSGCTIGAPDSQQACCTIDGCKLPSSHGTGDPAISVDMGPGESPVVPDEIASEPVE